MARHRSPSLRFVTTALVALLAGLVAPSGAATEPVGDPATAAAPARLLVGRHPGASETSVEASIAGAGGAVVGRVEALGVVVATVPAAGAPAALNSLRGSPGVSFAELDQEVTASETTPADPLWPQQWGPVRTNTPAAWDTTTGDPEVVVAVLDSGVDASHLDLAGALVPGRDVVNNDDDPADDNGHGTAVAGVLGARSNDVGIAGYCWACSIMAVKVLDEDGSGSLSQVAGGLVHAADHRARVINLSLSNPAPSITLDLAVNYARSKGAVVVAANGNDTDAIPRYPAASPGVLGVGATDTGDARYSFSSFGPWAELVAPGCHTAPRPGNLWRTFCGTSSAAPAVAGIAALLFATRPSATAAEVEQALLTTAVPVGPAAINGRVDAAAALAALTAPAPPTGATVPAAPTAVTAAAGNGSALVSWQPSTGEGQAPVQGYRVTATPGAVVALAPPGATSISVGPLVNGADYSFSVTALSGAGPGPAASTPPASTSPRLTTIERAAGAGRVETAVSLSRRAFAAASTVVVARSDNYADALAAAPLAGDLDVPLLLSASAGLSGAVSAEVRRLRASTAYLIGGQAALSPAVEAGLRAAGVTTIERVAGSNRFDTARLLAERVGGRSVYVTEGINEDPARGWPDAVAVSGLAAWQGRPILLTSRDDLPAETRDALSGLGATAATVVGGTAAVSSAVATMLADPDGDGVRQVAVSRLGGATRWDTARLLADRSLGAGAGAHRVWTATGGDWPDALAAGPAAAHKSAVLLLLDGHDLARSPAASAWLTSQNRRFQEAVIVGGLSSVAAEVESTILSLIG